MDNQIQQKQAVYSPIYDSAYKLNGNMQYYEAIFKRYGYKTPDAQLFQQKVWEYCGIDISKASGNDAPFYANDTAPVPIIIDKRFILTFGIPAEGEPSLADIAAGKADYAPARAAADINRIIFYDDTAAVADLIALSAQRQDKGRWVKFPVLYLKYEKNKILTTWAVNSMQDIGRDSLVYLSKHDNDSLVMTNLLFYHFTNKPEKQRFRRELVRKFLYQYRDSFDQDQALSTFLFYDKNDRPTDLKEYPFTQDEKDYYKCLFLEEELASRRNSNGNYGIDDAGGACYSDTAFSQRIAQKAYYGLPLLNILNQARPLVYTKERMDIQKDDEENGARGLSRPDIDFPDLPDNTLHGVINNTRGYVDVLKDKNDYTNKVTKITKGEEFVYWEDKNSDWWQVMTLNRIYGYISKSEIVRLD